MLQQAIAWILALCSLAGCGFHQEEQKQSDDHQVSVYAPSEEEQLITTCFETLWNEVYSGKDIRAGVSQLTEAEKVFFALNYLDMEIANGGLCQFFANDGGVFTPYISDYLDTVGAEEHKKLFDDFCMENKIDTGDTSSFAFSNIPEFMDLYNQYPFDQFDEAYYQLEPLGKYLVNYIALHPELVPE